MEATFQREERPLCTDRSCRGRGGGRGSLLFGALNPVICRSITKWQHNSSWNRHGRKGWALLTPFLKSQTLSKVKPIFFLCYCAGAAPTENTNCLTSMTGLDSSLPAIEMDTLHFAPSLRREWWSSGSRTAMQSRCLDHDFYVLCIWNLFIQSIYPTQDLVFSLRNMGHLGSKYHFSALLEERALLLFTLL